MVLSLVLASHGPRRYRLDRPRGPLINQLLLKYLALVALNGPAAATSGLAAIVEKVDLLQKHHSRQNHPQKYGRRLAPTDRLLPEVSRMSLLVKRS